MRFLITAQPSPDKPRSPSDAPPSDSLLAAYMKFNEDLHKAGVLIASEGLLPGGARARVAIVDGKRRLLDGPFAEAKELLGGLYLLEVASKEEAIAWALRCPVGLGHDDVLELYQMTAAEDLPPEVVQTIRRAAPTWAASFTKSSRPA